MFSSCGAGEDSGESLGLQETKPVNPKRNQSWIFIGRTDAEAEAPILWPTHVKNWLIGKDPDAGKNWGQGEKGVTEDEIAGWHCWLSGHGVSKLWEMVKDRETWRAACHGVAKNRTWLSGWTTMFQDMTHSGRRGRVLVAGKEMTGNWDPQENSSIDWSQQDGASVGQWMWVLD